MEKNFRECTNIAELKKNLKRIKAEGLDITMWQAQENDKQIISSLLEDFFEVNNNIYIDFLCRESFLVKKSKTIFIYCDHLKTLLKARVNQIKKGFLRIQIDPNFFLEEKRKIQRIDLFDKEIDIEIHRKNMHTEIKKEDNVRLNDLSAQGCGFVVSAGRASIYKKGMSVTIVKFGSIQPDSPIKGVVAHITPIKAIGGINDNSILVGICFDIAITNLDHLLQKIELGIG